MMEMLVKGNLMETLFGLHLWNHQETFQVMWMIHFQSFLMFKMELSHI